MCGILTPVHKPTLDIGITRNATLLVPSVVSSNALSAKEDPDACIHYTQNPSNNQALDILCVCSGEMPSCTSLRNRTFRAKEQNQGMRPTG